MTMRDDLVSRLKQGQDWIREPDHDEDDFTLDKICDWMNRRKMTLYLEAVSALEAKDAEIARLQCALSFWMPGVDLRLDDATRELAAHDAEMLAGYAGPIDPKCWGDEILERAITAESRISDLERQLAEETERCAAKADAGQIHMRELSRSLPNGEAKQCAQICAKAASDIAAAIRGGAK